MLVFLKMSSKTCFSIYIYMKKKIIACFVFIFCDICLWMIFVLNQTILECTNYVKISKIIVVKCAF